MRALAFTLLVLATHVLAQPKALLTSPGPGTQYVAPASISLAAQAGASATRVEFLANGELIGSATGAPYTFVWSSAPLGTHVLRARVVESDGQVSLSPPVPIQVRERAGAHANAAPTVSLTSPIAGNILTAPASVTLTAAAADSDGVVTKVDFYQGTILVGSFTTAPYTLALGNVSGGAHTFSASATDDLGAVTSSAPVTLTINVRPSVSITAPAANQVFHAAASVPITAIAADTDGAIQKVDFYDGTSLVGTATSGPYTITLPNAAIGAHTLTAVATDNHGATATSTPIVVTINAPPSVSLTSPANNATFNAPANIPMAVEVSDPDGSISSVGFFFGDTLITTRNAPPYSFTWTGVPQGTYQLTARVTDDLGATATSSTIIATVTQSLSRLYFIHVDHLNTPRLVANAQQHTVWRWDQQEPFGINVPDENPSGFGAFEFPMRFPGQYFDKETNLSYNFYRDFDPIIGRFVQSDPMGLFGGINTYSYVDGRPIDSHDFFGLARTCGTGRIGESTTPNMFFLPCCQEHDDCYDDCQQMPSKDSCDRTFNNCTIGQCSKRWIGIQFACEFSAAIYQASMRGQTAQTAFNNARKNCCGVGP